jgi:hypothetical protein
MIFGLVLAPCKESNGELNFFEIFAENRWKKVIIKFTP